MSPLMQSAAFLIFLIFLIILSFATLLLAFDCNLADFYYLTQGDELTEIYFERTLEGTSWLNLFQLLYIFTFTECITLACILIWLIKSFTTSYIIDTYHATIASVNKLKSRVNASLLTLLTQLVRVNASLVALLTQLVQAHEACHTRQRRRIEQDLAWHNIPGTFPTEEVLLSGETDKQPCGGYVDKPRRTGYYSQNKQGKWVLTSSLLPEDRAGSTPVKKKYVPRPRKPLPKTEITASNTSIDLLTPRGHWTPRRKPRPLQDYFHKLAAEQKSLDDREKEGREQDRIELEKRARRTPAVILGYGEDVTDQQLRSLLGLRTGGLSTQPAPSTPPRREPGPAQEQVQNLAHQRHQHAHFSQPATSVVAEPRPTTPTAPSQHLPPATTHLLDYDNDDRYSRRKRRMLSRPADPEPLPAPTLVPRPVPGQMVEVEDTEMVDVDSDGDIDMPDWDQVVPASSLPGPASGSNPPQGPPPSDFKEEDLWIMEAFMSGDLTLMPTEEEFAAAAAAGL